MTKRKAATKKAKTNDGYLTRIKTMLRKSAFILAGVCGFCTLITIAGVLLSSNDDSIIPTLAVLPSLIPTSTTIPETMVLVTATTVPTITMTAISENEQIAPIFLSATAAMAIVAQPTATITNTPFLNSIPRPTNTPPPTTRPSGTTYYANAGEVRVRECAQLDNTTCPIVDTLLSGNAIEVIGTVQGDLFRGSNEWFEAIWRNRTVYVHTSLLQRTQPLPTRIPAPSFSSNPSSNAQTVPNNQASTSSSCSCSGPDLDCSDFRTQREAQACHNKCVAEIGYDFHGLDSPSDADSIACESLP